MPMNIGENMNFYSNLSILIQDNLEIDLKIMKKEILWKTWRNPGKVLEICQTGKVGILHKWTLVDHTSWPQFLADALKNDKHNGH